MTPHEPPRSDLTAYLKREDATLYGKVGEIRGEVTRWLTYVPHTFGHYTSHTIDHSDEIILQISKVLFNPPRRGAAVDPIVDLGPVAAYILIVAAYLHDAGMVASDSERTVILVSDEWREWVTKGAGTTRWNQVNELRDRAGSDALRHFAVDRATRLLIAEFIRRQHHRRAGDLVRNRAIQLGRIDVGEPNVREAIAEICIAHGVDLRDLEDDIRFPEARDILGERVNLRLLATLLRIGDLLDMRFDRACPLLLQAACPLPADSYAHWTQYEAIVHRLTAPDRIEIRAECRTHDEHRALHDWCSWLVKEIKSLPARLPRTQWVFPIATIGDRCSIEIKPARGATYIPENWTFELDQDAVFQRLIADAYTSPSAFIRELIQNALDATRCRMYEDLRAASLPVPDFPTGAPEETRERYPVRVSLREETITNELSGEKELVQVITVEDRGTGMDLEVIHRYLLQVGRSYYTTAEFRREYPFQPTSRFGIGFLSVFAVSDHVTVETYRASKPKDGPLRLVLTGPRSYVLTERTNTARAGTRVEVRLRTPLTESFERIINELCIFVEFPIEIDDRDRRTVVRARRAQESSLSWRYPLDPKVEFRREFYPIKRRGLEGGFAVVARTQSGKTRWVSHYRHVKTGPPTDLAMTPQLAIHGISTGQVHYGTYRDLCAQVDVRREARIDLSRSGWHLLITLPDVLSRVDEILEEHLGPPEKQFDFDEWQYRCSLMSDTSPNLSFWCSRSDMVPYYESGCIKQCSVVDLLKQQTVYLPYTPPGWRRPRVFADESALSRDLPVGAIVLHSAVGWWRFLWDQVYPEFEPCSVLMSAETPVVTLRRSPTVSRTIEDRLCLISEVSLPDDVIRFGSGDYGWVIINARSKFGDWWRAVNEAFEADKEKSHTWLAIERAVRANAKYSDEEIKELIKIWNAKLDLSEQLICPVPHPQVFDSMPSPKRGQR